VPVPLGRLDGSVHRAIPRRRAPGSEEPGQVRQVELAVGEEIRLPRVRNAADREADEAGALKDEELEGVADLDRIQKIEGPSMVTAYGPSARIALAADTTSVGLVALGRAVAAPTTTSAARAAAATRGAMDGRPTSQATCRGGGGR
jgi:hypothetical protein